MTTKVLKEIKQGCDLKTQEGKEFLELCENYSSLGNTTSLSFLRNFLAKFRAKTGKKIDGKFTFKVADYKEGDEIGRCYCGQGLSKVTYVRWKHTDFQGQTTSQIRDPIQAGDDHFNLLLKLDEKLGTGDLVKFESEQAKNRIRRQRKKDLEDSIDGILNNNETLIGMLDEAGINAYELANSEVLADYSKMILNGDIEGLEFNLNQNNSRSMVNYAVGELDKIKDPKIREVVVKYTKNYFDMTPKDHALFFSWILENRMMKAEASGRTFRDDGIFLREQGNDEYDFDSKLYITRLTKKGREPFTRKNKHYTLDDALNEDFLKPVEARSIERALPGIKEKRKIFNREVLTDYFEEWRTLTEAIKDTKPLWDKEKIEWKQYLNRRDHAKATNEEFNETHPELLLWGKFTPLESVFKRTELGQGKAWANLCERVSMRYSKEVISEFYTTVQQIRMSKTVEDDELKLDIMKGRYINGIDFEKTTGISLAQVIDRLANSYVKTNKEASDKQKTRARVAKTTLSNYHKFTEKMKDEMVESSKFNLVSKEIAKGDKPLIMKYFNVVKDHVEVAGQTKEQLDWIFSLESVLEMEMPNELKAINQAKYINPEDAAKIEQQYNSLKYSRCVQTISDSKEMVEYQANKQLLNEAKGHKIYESWVGLDFRVKEVQGAVKTGGNFSHVNPESVKREIAKLSEYLTLSDVKNELINQLEFVSKYCPEGYTKTRAHSLKIDKNSINELLMGIKTETQPAYFSKTLKSNVQAAYESTLFNNGLPKDVFEIVDKESVGALMQQNVLFKVEGYSDKRGKERFEDMSSAFSKKYGGIGLGFNMDTKQWGFTKIGRHKLVDKLRQLKIRNDEVGSEARLSISVYS